MKEVTLEALLEAGCHFGHKTNKWNPKATSFIYKAVGNTHIIDLAKTQEGLNKACEFIYQLTSKGGEVVFLGTKRQASAIVKEEAERVGAPYFNSRWVGGFITNWNEVRKNIEKMNTIRTNLKDKTALEGYTKREKLLLERDVDKLSIIYGGVTRIEKRPDALFIIDVSKEFAALSEAKQYKIPTIGVVDTNADPSTVMYPIPANDDAVGSITLIMHTIAEAYKEGKEKYQTAKEKATTTKPQEAKPLKKESKSSTVNRKEKSK